MNNGLLILIIIFIAQLAHINQSFSHVCPQAPPFHFFILNFLQCLWCFAVYCALYFPSYFLFLCSAHFYKLQARAFLLCSTGDCGLSSP